MKNEPKLSDVIFAAIIGFALAALALHWFDVLIK